MNNLLYYLYIGMLSANPLAECILSAPRTTSNATRQCIQFEASIPVHATTLIVSQPRVDSNIDAIDWTLNATTWSTASAFDRIVDYKNISQAFTVNAQLCLPSGNAEKADILQIATHGNAWDKRYWDAEINPDEYSYLNAALNQGYAVLTFDRIGTGASEKPDAYDVVQSPVEVEILKGLTERARDGTLIRSSTVLSVNGSEAAFAAYRPSKIVHVGHSYGSALTTLLLGKYGNISDGAILSGLLLNTQLGKVDVAHFNHDFAREHDPIRFAEYGSGYFVITSTADAQKLYFRKGGVEPEMLYYTDAIKQPETVGDYTSEMTFLPAPAVDFTGPVQFIVGEFDYVNCDGNCTGTYLPENSTYLFPSARNVSAYLQPNTGHVLTLALNASGSAQEIFDYLDLWEL